MAVPLQIFDWGLIPYQEALEKQERRLEQVAAHEASEALIFCCHLPVVTKGRATTAGDLEGWDGDLVTVTRGGRATYHGPGQIVIYPILDLRYQRNAMPSRDIHRFLKLLGETSALALNRLPLKERVEFRQGETELGQHLTGLWVGQKKVGSLGVAVRKWITFHGLALNLEKDPRSFQGIRPCGFSSEMMGYLQDIAFEDLQREKVKALLAEELSRAFQREAT